MNCKYEKLKFAEGYSNIIGCDEVGRACLAGPVVAGAVILDPQKFAAKINRRLWYSKVRDSKIVPAEIREELVPIIHGHALAWGIGIVSEKLIDEINIHHASLLAMRQAVENLFASFVIPEPPILVGGIRDPDLSLDSGSRLSSLSGLGRDDTTGILLVVDGRFKVPHLTMPQEVIVNGDAKILSVAAASIVAKVYRDNLMKQLHQEYPVYNLAQHKGYPTSHHRKMIKQNGLSPIHRLSFCEKLVFLQK